jgi:FAD/FMN-containing dehydrogenase
LFSREIFFAPETIEDAAAMLARAWADRQQTVVVDRVEEFCRCNPDVARLSLRRLDRITRVDQNNLAIVSESGVTIGALREAAATAGLWCPALRWLPAAETIGCAVAGGHGRRTRRFGAVADYLLGMRFVCPSVGLVRHGGLAIKNATGYNLTASVAGSRGRLAVIVEVILRLLPLPRDRVVRQFRSAEPSPIWTNLPRLFSSASDSGRNLLSEPWLSAVELWHSTEQAVSNVLVETDCRGAEPATMAGFGCTLEIAGAEAWRGASVRWPPEDVATTGSIVRLAAEPSVLMETIALVQTLQDASTAITSILAELTGGALEVTVADSGTAARILAVAAKRGNATGRERVRRALKLAFDPLSLLLEYPSFAISNGSSP